VFIVEAMAQTAACVACLTLGAETKGKLVFFTTIESARFRKPVRPGDLLELHVEKVTAKGPLWKFKGIAMVDAKKVAEADFGAMIVDPGN
jgi:3-hydroxyacyl-[acyl-carrier-protein] dehydratase